MTVAVPSRGLVVRHRAPARRDRRAWLVVGAAVVAWSAARAGLDPRDVVNEHGFGQVADFFAAAVSPVLTTGFLRQVPGAVALEGVVGRSRGAAVAILAMVRVAKPLEYKGISWTNFALGGWLVIAPFVMGYDDPQRRGRQRHHPRCHHPRAGRLERLRLPERIPAAGEPARHRPPCRPLTRPVVPTPVQPGACQARRAGATPWTRE